MKFHKESLANYLLWKMMYVSGETAEASPETTGMIEEIVRQQVIEMVIWLFVSSDAVLVVRILKLSASTMYWASFSTRQ